MKRTCWNKKHPLFKSSRRIPAILLACFLVWGCSSGPDESGPAGEREEIDFTVYTHTFPEGLQGCATGDYLDPAFRYPSIPVDESYRHILTFRMSPMAPPSLKPVPSHGPVILYTDAMDVIVFSPLDYFFVSLITFADNKLSYGVEGEVEQIPAGFSHRFILVRGKGLNATMERWGELLRNHYGRTRTDRYADTGLSTLGYWTDNGGYYYYQTEPGLNEEETLLAVKADADAQGIPYGYFQIDSWWYYKEEGRGGLILWEPQDWMFPEGLAPFQQKLGQPLVAHNRWFSVDNGYRDRYPFVEGGGTPNMALPLTRGVFDEFMQNAVSWGIFTYEQDWLSSQFWGIPYLRQGVDRADRWMTDIDSAARDRGLTTQICMAGPAHFMQAVKMPSVTTSRPSIDYMAGIPKVIYWPQFLQVGMLAWAVGVLPFKDNFQTTAGQRPILSEDMGEQEALISILSAGMVGPSDRIGASDAPLLLRTCRKDGLLLKPDRPAAPLDAMFLDHRRPYTTVTHSRRKGLGNWYYLAAYHLERGSEVTRMVEDLASLIFYGVPLEEMFVYPSEVDDWRVDLAGELGITNPVVVYNWRTGNVFQARDAFEIPPMEKRAEYAYFVLAPVFSNGLALIGETEKFVTLADKRFKKIEPVPDAVRVRVEGVPGEKVSLRAFDTVSGDLLDPVDVVVGPEGEAEALLGRGRIVSRRKHQGMESK